ncbi:hypothetical protein [Xanthobacter sp. 126]|uniref:hypothetical protein n=1 Tax=Xanthobacter sp. 126 TaxID=1131814 RepID=UPI0012DE324A|nr:hypothetical protein [Xanthobacter sp. 126]
MLDDLNIRGLRTPTDAMPSHTTRPIGPSESKRSLAHSSFVPPARAVAAMAGTVVLSMLAGDLCLAPTATASSLSRSIPAISAHFGRHSERAVSRLRQFELYEDDWDGMGAKAPSADSLNAAIDFAQKLRPWHPRPFATVDRDGFAVLQLEDGAEDKFSSITFLSDLDVEIYSRHASNPSDYFEGALASPEARSFLAQHLQIYAI